MQLRIKLVPRCEHDHRGEFIVKSKNTCEIQISKKYNKTLDEFGATLLHELLHLWVTILQSHGLKEGIRLEHRFINTVTPMILKTLVEYYK
jgi:hypothetical protein